MAEYHPDLPWTDVLSKYKALANAEDAALMAELGMDEVDEEESEEVGEGANPVDVGRSEELVGSTTDAVESSPTS